MWSKLLTVCVEYEPGNDTHGGGAGGDSTEKPYFNTNLDLYQPRHLIQHQQPQYAVRSIIFSFCTIDGASQEGQL